MPLFGGADEIVILKIHHAQQVTKILRDLIGKGLRIDPGGTRRGCHFLAVFVGAGQEFYIIPIEPLKTRQHITRKRRVGMPDMRGIIHIIDRRRNIIGSVTGHL